MEKITLLLISGILIVIFGIVSIIIGPYTFDKGFFYIISGTILVLIYMIKVTGNKILEYIVYILFLIYAILLLHILGII